MTHLWRPFSAPLAAPTMRLQRGTGCRVVDVQGREYLDAASGLWNVSLGLRNDALVERMHAQLQDLSYGTLFHATNAPAEQLCERLVERVGEPAHAVYLSTTGSSAVEVALRVAQLHHRARGQSRKRGVISFDRAYHGSSLMGLSAGGLVGDEGDAGDRLPGFFHIVSPSDEAASLESLRTLLAARAHEIACLILEPVLGSAGVIVPGRGFMAELSSLCRAHDVLIVADEVATGAGRCGAFLASTLLGLQPDIVALSKGLNSGYFPLGATVFAREVVAPIAARGLPLQFGCTQDGNPVGCVSALATLDELDAGRHIERAAGLGRSIRSQLQERCPRSVVKEVRGLGLMLAIELVHDDGSQTPFSATEAEQARHACQEEGLLTYHFDSGLSLFPALTMTDDEAQLMLDVLVDVLNQLA
jgi:adenosylmethionine-8-amino-7-oxononanoate aminotransferase